MNSAGLHVRDGADPVSSSSSSRGATVHFWALPPPFHGVGGSSGHSGCGYVDEQTALLRAVTAAGFQRHKQPGLSPISSASSNAAAPHHHALEVVSLPPPLTAAEPMQQLAARLLRHPRRQFARPAASERDWLRGCQRAWAGLGAASGDLADFFRGLLRTTYAQTY